MYSFANTRPGAHGRLGGGVVESYPEDVAGRVSKSFLYNAAVSMFERQGFQRTRQIGKNHWVVVKVVAGMEDEVGRNYTVKVLLEFPDEGIMQNTTVSVLGENTYRIEDTAMSLLGLVSYYDVIEAEAIDKGHLAFRRIVEPTSWQIKTLLLSRNVIESKQLKRIVDEIEEYGGRAELIMGGILVVALPPNTQLDVNKKIDDLIEDLEA